MIRSIMGYRVELVRMAEREDIKKMLKRQPIASDLEKIEGGRYMVCVNVFNDGSKSEERICDLHVLHSDAEDEIYKAAVAAGNNRIVSFFTNPIDKGQGRL